jgi:DUF1680 family protein
MIPTWTYVRGAEGIYVNLFIGSTIQVEKVAGTTVEMVQETDYPWSGEVAIIVNPQESKEFTLFVRVPDRSTSKLYVAEPPVKGLTSLTLNGEPINIEVENGYVPIRRVWQAGDRVELSMPMEVQKATADERIVANRDRVALRYGPLVYNVETADQADIHQSLGNGPLEAVWMPDLLRGVMAIRGNWSDGSPMLAIPNFARNNRETPEPKERGTVTSQVWIKK